MKIVMPGGSGQVGMVLERAFSAAGHEVVVLSRSARRRLRVSVPEWPPAARDFVAAWRAAEVRA